MDINGILYDKTFAAKLILFLRKPIAVDRRYNVKLCQEHYEDNKKAVMRLLRNPQLFKEIQWYHNYGSLIDKYDQDYIFKRGDPEPVATGWFMNQWEPVHEDFGVNEKQWNAMSISKRRIIESKVQAKFWAKHEYESHWLEQYARKAFDKLWWHDRQKLKEDAQYNLRHPDYIKLVHALYIKEHKKFLKELEK